METFNRKKEIVFFLKTVPHLEKIGEKAIFSLSERFKVHPTHLGVLIRVISANGGFYEN